MIHSNQKPAVTVIRYSCLTGKAVWLYQGPSKQAARAAYRRACERELSRVRMWKKISDKYKVYMRNILDAHMVTIPITSELTDAQKKAARQLLRIANEPYPCYLEFYNHIIEERRQREENKRIRQLMYSMNNNNI